MKNWSVLFVAVLTTLVAVTTGFAQEDFAAPLPGGRTITLWERGYSRLIFRSGAFLQIDCAPQRLPVNCLGTKSDEHAVVSAQVQWRYDEADHVPMQLQCYRNNP